MCMIVKSFVQVSYPIAWAWITITVQSAAVAAEGKVSKEGIISGTLVVTFSLPFLSVHFS